MQGCGCIRGDNFFFFIKDISCDLIIYEDLSEWMDENSCSVPQEYDVHTEICGVDLSRTAAIIPRLLCCIDSYLIKPDYDEEMADLLIRYLHSVNAAAKYDMTDVAEVYYKKAKKLTERLNCNC